ncbi:MAG: methyltransferase domain-containing protein [Telmatospirillum sp.]|nr:methyltransferase domain-containing protein [Telmatospirillum sp.]
MAEPSIDRQVQTFYADLPFNYCDTDEEAARLVRDNPLTAYPDLVRLLAGGTVERLVEFACGTGWCCNAAAACYGVPALGIDFTAKAIDRARAVADRLGLAGKVRFEEGDLLAALPPPAPLVVCIGALHHLPAARAGFLHIARAGAPGGHLFVGLYHRPGRRVFLDLLRGVADREGERAALRRFAAMLGRDMEDRLTLSWFRDQVLHPHETQHTLAETLDWLDQAGMRLVSTSINRFAPIDGSPAALAEREWEYETLSRRANIDENRFFPGFFTILAHRPEAAG